jgi:SAM-dependent methyltransferase
LRRYWDRDAATYDLWPEHSAHTASERAAWSTELARLLPHRGARLLDVGAGTGFLSIAAARMDYRVTALDISEGMLARLRGAANRAEVDVHVVRGSAHRPPSGPFDAVMARLTLWTLPDPGAALEAWKAVAPEGRLLIFDGLWSHRDRLESARRRGRTLLHSWKRRPPEHHAPYPEELAVCLPLADDPSPERSIELIEAAGWQTPRLTRLRDVEFARGLALSSLERLLGVTPEYAILAHAA